MSDGGEEEGEDLFDLLRQPVDPTEADTVLVISNAPEESTTALKTPERTSLSGSIHSDGRVLATVSSNAMMASVPKQTVHSPPPQQSISSSPPPTSAMPTVAPPFSPPEQHPSQPPPLTTPSHERLSLLTATPLTANTGADTTGGHESGSGTGLTVIHTEATTAHTSTGSRDGNARDGGTGAAHPSQVFVERFSGIRVRRATRSFEQLQVWLAQCPFVEMARARQACVQATTSTNTARGPSRSGGEPPSLPQTCIGVVVRKTDPKQGKRGAFAVLTLWNMRGVSPVPQEELPFLLCSGAFDTLYSQLAVGSVVAVSNLTPVHSNASSSTTASLRPSARGDGDVLLRLSVLDDVRVLGYAADLTTCASISRNSQERCGNLVNSQHSPYCTFHVSDLRKVARGGATNTNSSGHSGGGPTGPLRGNALTSTANSKVTSTAAMKGGTLLTRMQLSGAMQPRPLIPTNSAGSSPQASPYSQNGRVAPPMVALRMKQPPSPSLAKRAGPGGVGGVPSTRPALTSPGFFTVQGGSGLPTETAGSGTGSTMDLTGTYAGVAHGQPLVAADVRTTQPTGPAYPSPSALAISTRGREVLEAARRQADERDQQQLLLRALGPPQSSQSSPSPSTTQITGSTKRAKKRPSATASTAPAGAAANSVRGSGGEGSLPHRTTFAFASSATATGASAGASVASPPSPSPLSTEGSSVAAERSSLPSSESLSRDKRARTEGGAHGVEDISTAKGVPHASPSVPSASSASSTTPAAVKRTPSVSDALVQAIKAQYAPLPSSRAGDVFTPLRSHGSVEGVVLPEKSAVHHILTRTVTGRTSALVNAVAAALKTDHSLAPPSVASAASSSQPRQFGSAPTTTTSRVKDAPLTLLGSVADRVHSSNDDLREAAEHARLNAVLDRRIAQEKAREVLEGVTEQKLNAVYCHTCGRWYLAVQTTCQRDGHHTERKPTTKRFVCCEHCGMKTFVLGDSTQPWKLLPRCPRCTKEAAWVWSNAAPELAAVREDPHPD